MDEQITRLLISEKPYQDESFIGYLLRLAEMNAIPSFRWIYKLIIPKNFVSCHLTIKTNLRTDRKKFARLSGISRREVDRLLYDDEENISCIGNYDLLIQGQLIKTDYIELEKSKICPQCLTEKNYCRRNWDLLPVVVCPFHKCLLIDRCPQCSQQISWYRPGVSVCRCQFDFRRTNLTLLGDHELRFGRYFYDKLKYPLPDLSAAFEYPLNELNIKDLLELLFFTAAHLNGLSSFNPHDILIGFSVSQIHKFFCEAVVVFDNWSVNYHRFIDEWHDKAAAYKQVRYCYSYSDDFIPAKYEKYKSLISELNYFGSENFEFLHYEFLNYLEKRRSESVKLR